LAALVEVHDEAELERALTAGARLVGVNNRNLRTLAVDVGLSKRLAPRVSPSAVAVSESGLSSVEELRSLVGLGYRAFLIGERFMTAPDPATAITRMVGQ
jgi:indole-3-glycerol phosphate synthase